MFSLFKVLHVSLCLFVFLIFHDIYRCLWFLLVFLFLFALLFLGFFFDFLFFGFMVLVCFFGGCFLFCNDLGSSLMLAHGRGVLRREVPGRGVEKDQSLGSPQQLFFFDP